MSEHTSTILPRWTTRFRANLLDSGLKRETFWRSVTKTTPTGGRYVHWYMYAGHIHIIISSIYDLCKCSLGTYIHTSNISQNAYLFLGYFVYIIMICRLVRYLMMGQKAYLVLFQRDVASNSQSTTHLATHAHPHSIAFSVNTLEVVHSCRKHS